MLFSNLTREGDHVCCSAILPERVIMCVGSAILPERVIMCAGSAILPERVIMCVVQQSYQRG